MKLNRFFALAVVALLVVGATGAISAHSFAQTSTPPAQAQATEAPEVVSGPDMDNVDEQVGDQSALDTGEAVKAPDTGTLDEQSGDQSALDNGTEAGASADGQDTAPVGTPAITADQAKALAEASLNAGAATKVELDDENGQLVYSVQIGASDVKVDALTGAVLGTDSGQD